MDKDILNKCFINELDRAKYFHKHSENQEYWMGYILGLHSAYTENFQVPDGLAESDSEKGRGFKDGLNWKPKN